MRLARLNLGCGQDPTTTDMINVDLAVLPGVNVIADLDRPWPFASGRTGYIVASHVFEHLADPVLFMREAWRVLADGGILDIRVPGGRDLGGGYWLPHSNAFTDPTHRRFCTPLTWDYWVPGTGLHGAYGAAYGSPPACFAYSARTLNGEQREEYQAVLRKLGS